MSEEEESLLGWEEDRQSLQQFLALGGAPAYMVRATRVEQEYHRLVQTCQSQRKEWVQIARLRMGKLLALAQDWQTVRPLLQSDSDLNLMATLYDELHPQLRVPVVPTRSPRVLRKALADVCESLHFFNTRWQKYIRSVDLQPLNQLREGYNKYYILEKECLLGSSVIARKGFQKLEPLSHQDLLELMPLLAVPQRSSK